MHESVFNLFDYGFSGTTEKGVIYIDNSNHNIGAFLPEEEDTGIGL